MARRRMCCLLYPSHARFPTMRERMTTFARSIYNGVIAADIAINQALNAICHAQAEIAYRIEQAAGLAYAKALHKETAAATHRANLYASVAEVAKRDAASAKEYAKETAKANNKAAARLESDYAA